MEKLAAIAEDRSRIYWMLSQFFLHPPEMQFLEELARIPTLAETEGVATAVDTALRQLQQGVAAADIDDLRREHLRLFGGIHEGFGPPPPYESLYREGRLLGESTESVMAHYRSNGISLADEPAAPEDHLGLELKYVALLCNQESRRWQDGNFSGGQESLTAQQDFVAHHLRAWAPAYCQKLQVETHSPFYRAVAELTAASIEFDAQQVGCMMSELSDIEKNMRTQGGLQ